MNNTVYYVIAMATIFISIIAFILAARHLSYAVSIADKQKRENISYNIPVCRLVVMALLTCLSILTASKAPDIAKTIVLSIYFIGALACAKLSLEDTHFLVDTAYAFYIEYILNPGAGPMSDLPPSPDEMNLFLFCLEPSYDDYFPVAYPEVKKKVENKLHYEN